MQVAGLPVCLGGLVAACMMADFESELMHLAEKRIERAQPELVVVGVVVVAVAVAGSVVVVVVDCNNFPCKVASKTYCNFSGIPLLF